jgi:aspartyl protease family protein
MYVLASILVIALFTFLFGDAMEKQRNPNSNPSSEDLANGGKSITLRRNRAGHYVLNGTVNDQPAEFLVDTGATAVSVSRSFAKRLKLSEGQAMQAVTANGLTIAYATQIDSLVVGEIEELNVRASIVPNLPGDQILLGMSFLKRLDFTQRGDTLILTQQQRSN